MRLRTLGILLFLSAIVLLFTFVIVSGMLVWSYLSPLLPDRIVIGGAVFPPVIVLGVFGTILLALIALVLISFTVLLNRAVVRPLAGLTAAMATFADSQQLPQLSMPRIRELSDLAGTFMALAEKVQATHARDAEMSRVKSDFISTAAHQLRTPLTGIRWALEALSKEELTENQRALVESAQSKSHDLVGTVGTLLDISSIESGKHAYRFEPVQLPEVAAHVVKDLLPIAEERKVILQLLPPTEKLPPARADRQQMTWILTNLIENAIRYTPAGGTATVSFAPAPGRVRTFVKDTGIGIPEQDRENIFERFYRAGNAITKENAGNGLGLYIARTIATDHGGELAFAGNQDGPGTTFTLSLPAAG